MTNELASTCRRLVDRVPPEDPGRVVGRFLRAPVIEGRQAEGGLRLRQRYKASQPGQPLVSIVTICLRAAKTLEQAMQSVFRQTYRRLQ
jgi:hypothetical protein